MGTPIVDTYRNTGKQFLILIFCGYYYYYYYYYYYLLLLLFSQTAIGLSPGDSGATIALECPSYYS
jgi:hypothetical protein